jgi:hypothetical protein
MTGIFTPAYSVSKRTGSDGGLADRGNPVVNAQLAIDVAEMDLERPLRDRQLRGDPV